ncbi:uncharacterized protein METZ01_LOCUS511153, partial [marine metagenome]
VEFEGGDSESARQSREAYWWNRPSEGNTVSPDGSTFEYEDT